MQDLDFKDWLYDEGILRDLSGKITMLALGGALALGAGALFGNQSPKCFNIFLITSESSINEIILIDPKHLGHNSGSTFFQKKRRPGSYFLYQSRPISPGNLAGQFRFKEAGDFIVGVCLFRKTWLARPLRRLNLTV